MNESIEDNGAHHGPEHVGAFVGNRSYRRSRDRRTTAWGDPQWQQTFRSRGMVEERKPSRDRRVHGCSDGDERWRRYFAAGLESVDEDILGATSGRVHEFIGLLVDGATAEDLAKCEEAAVAGLKSAMETYDLEKGTFDLWAFVPIRMFVFVAAQDAGNPEVLLKYLNRRMVLARAVLRFLREIGSERRNSDGELRDAVWIEEEDGPSSQRGSRECVTVVRDEGLDGVVETTMEGFRGDLVGEDSTFMVLERSDLSEALSHLNPRETEVVIRRFGLDGERPLTLAEMGKRFMCSSESIANEEMVAVATLCDALELMLWT